jgi:hypothetical protein
VQITGSLASVKAVRRTLKQNGFFDKNNSVAGIASPLDGHWETEHGLTVIIEGKMVRWSRQRASKLRFTRPDRRACVLTIYGEPSQGKLLPSALVPGATKSLQWDNGDVWHSHEGRAIGPVMLCSQSMTKASRDECQHVAYRARSSAVLKCVSPKCLHLPVALEEIIKEFLGNDSYYFQVCFTSDWNPACMDAIEAEADIFAFISRRHAHVGLRHCWAEKSAGCCGQRTLVNGEEVDEDCFNRHIKAVRLA